MKGLREVRPAVLRTEGSRGSPQRRANSTPAGGILVCLDGADGTPNYAGKVGFLSPSLLQHKTGPLGFYKL